MVAVAGLPARVDLCPSGAADSPKAAKDGIRHTAIVGRAGSHITHGGISGKIRVQTLDRSGLRDVGFCGILIAEDNADLVTILFEKRRSTGDAAMLRRTARAKANRAQRGCCYGS